MTQMTSREAYASINAATLKEKVRRFLLTRGHVGATAEEIEQQLVMRGNTVRPRLIELRSEGVVALSGRYRFTSSGRRAEVNVLKQYV